MNLETLNSTLIPVTLRLGPKGREVEISYRLNLGKMTLNQNIAIIGLSDKLKAATDHPTEKSYVEALHKALAGALLPVLEEWDMYATPADEEAGINPLPITAETLKSFPGPALIAMGTSVFKLTQTADADADSPEVSGAD